MSSNKYVPTHCQWELLPPLSVFGIWPSDIEQMVIFIASYCHYNSYYYCCCCCLYTLLLLKLMRIPRAEQTFHIIIATIRCYSCYLTCMLFLLLLLSLLLALAFGMYVKNCWKLSKFHTKLFSHQWIFHKHTHGMPSHIHTHTHTIWIYLADCQATQLPLSSLTHDTCSLVRLANWPPPVHLL